MAQLQASTNVQLLRHSPGALVTCPKSEDASAAPGTTLATSATPLHTQKDFQGHSEMPLAWRASRAFREHGRRFVSRPS